MPGPAPTLSEDNAIERIVNSVSRAAPGSAPFALVLGAGFSHGLVPDARQLVEESLPLWDRSRQGHETYEELKRLPEDERATGAREFWNRFVRTNAGRNTNITLHPDTGLPTDYAVAYLAAFNSHFHGAAGEPVEARRFQRALMRLDQPRLNAAHFLLASILGVQPGHSRPSETFKTRAAFCRLILTTNFDPFLQIALQAVNRLYVLSDTPDLGVGDDELQDQTDAIRLIYLHGSIHRRKQAASDDDIQAIKRKNAAALRTVLENHGVIVLGYSGWDDVIVEALAACSRFDYRLYWCGREADPGVKGAFGPRVAGEILSGQNAEYVSIKSAGVFMGKLFAGLVRGRPRLLESPIRQLREMLQTVDLAELNSGEAPGSEEAFGDSWKVAVERLRQAEQDFNNPAGAGLQAPYLISAASLSFALGNFAESIRLYTQALELASLTCEQRAQALVDRGRAFESSEQTGAAQSDWTEVVEMADAPAELRARALYCRASMWEEKDDAEKAVADYTLLVEHFPAAPAKQLAKALNSRAWILKGDDKRALADYTRVIELPEAPITQLARAFYNRAQIWAAQGDSEKALADYTRVIELPGVSVERLAQSLCGRGIIWVRDGKTEQAIEAFTRVIEWPGVPTEQLADALNNRADVWRRIGKTDQAVADSSRVIELRGASELQVALAGKRRTEIASES